MKQLVANVRLVGTDATRHLDVAQSVGNAVVAGYRRRKRLVPFPNTAKITLEIMLGGKLVARRAYGDDTWHASKKIERIGEALAANFNAHALNSGRSPLRLFSDYGNPPVFRFVKLLRLPLCPGRRLERRRLKTPVNAYVPFGEKRIAHSNRAPVPLDFAAIRFKLAAEQRRGGKHRAETYDNFLCHIYGLLLELEHRISERTEREADLSVIAGPTPEMTPE